MNANPQHKRPPGPPNGVFGLGNLASLRRDVLGHYVNLVREYGDSSYYRIGPFGIYLFSHPDQVYEVLSTKAKSFHKTKRLRQVLGRWNGNSLLLNEGGSWRRQRRLVQQAFHPSQVQSYGEMFVRHAHRLVDECRGREIDVVEPLSRLTLAGVAEALFGTAVEPVADAFTREVAVLQKASIEDFLASVITPLWYPSAGRRELRRAIRFIDDFVMGIIAERRRMAAERRPPDLLSMLLAAVDEQGDQNGMTDRQVRDESVNLLLGGNETTATALCWTLYLLAKHPHEQQRLRGEIEAVLGARRATAADAERLPLIEQALKEAMRLYPPVYATTRSAVENVRIGEFDIPRGAQIDLPFYVTQRDARWFPEPERFLPERFAPECERELRRGAYAPFGAGPRACVGKGFAMLEATLALATILQHVRVELPADHVGIELEAQVSLHPQGGLKLRFEAIAYPA